MIFSGLFTDVPVLIVISIFIFALTYCLIKYIDSYKNLNEIIKILSGIKKSDLNYRFKEIDGKMCANSYVAPIWNEFKNTLVFSESVALKNEGSDYKYQDISSTVQNVQTTADPLYYFNDDTLLTSKFNYKMLQTMPTILTGCGPLFTFFKIAIAFGRIDFSSQEKTIESLSSFMAGMQSAAMVSVIAVASSLIFMIIEKTLYSLICTAPLNKIQNMMGELFANISSEKFLYELLRETKIQNNSSANLITSIPKEFKGAFNETMAANLVPYLENLIFGLNQLNKEMKVMAKNRPTNVDDVDGLF